MTNGAEDALRDLGQGRLGVTDFRILGMPEGEMSPLAKSSSALVAVGQVPGTSFSFDRMIDGSQQYLEDATLVRW